MSSSSAVLRLAWAAQVSSKCCWLVANRFVVAAKSFEVPLSPVSQ